MKIIIIILYFLSTSICIANENLIFLLKDYYSQSFGLKIDDINIEIIKMQEFNEYSQNNELKIETNYDHLKCGIQHAWLKVLDNGKIIKKTPITIVLSVFKDVWITNNDIKRNQPLSNGMFRRNRQEIKRNYSKYVLDDLDFSGKMKISRKMVKGTILTKQMLSVMPDVKRGDRINVQIMSENFSINMPGKAKQDGILGENIHVVLDKTGKRLKGKIESSNEIIVRN